MQLSCCLPLSALPPVRISALQYRLLPLSAFRGCIRITLELFQQGAVPQAFGFARMFPGKVIVALDGINPSEAYMRGGIIGVKLNRFQEASDGCLRATLKVREGSESKVSASVGRVLLKERHLLADGRINI